MLVESAWVTNTMHFDQEHSGVIDLNEWMDWTTFDLMGDLTFGETFGCLQQVKYHSWVALIFNSIRAVSITGAIKQWPWIDAVWQFLIGGIYMRAMRQHQELVVSKVNRRLAAMQQR